MIGNPASAILREIRENLEIAKGISPGGNSANKFILDSNASSSNGYYDPGILIIYDGTGKGQARQIWDYIGSTKTCILNRDFKTIPDDTSKYKIFYNAGNSHVNEGMAQAGGASTITLNTLASSQNSVYLGQIIFIASGTGQDQARMVVGYNGTTKVATVDSPWIVQPDATSVYAIYPFPGFVHGRPSQNSSDNVLIRDVIGNKTDFVQVPYTSGIQSIMAHLNTGYYHMHGFPFTYPDYADPILLTASSGAWTKTGTIVEVIPANAITKAFDLHWVVVSEISGNGYIKIDFFAGPANEEVQIGGTKVFRTSNFVQEGDKRIQILQQPANTRISARISDSTAGQLTCKIVSFDGHVYSGSLT